VPGEVIVGANEVDGRSDGGSVWGQGDDGEGFAAVEETGIDGVKAGAVSHGAKHERRGVAGNRRHALWGLGSVFCDGDDRELTSAVFDGADERGERVMLADC
jgi:hypothetical protein